VIGALLTECSVRSLVALLGTWHSAPMSVVIRYPGLLVRLGHLPLPAQQPDYTMPFSMIAPMASGCQGSVPGAGMA
jgi:hypothetical protein